MTTAQKPPLSGSSETSSRGKKPVVLRGREAVPTPPPQNKYWLVFGAVYAVAALSIFLIAFFAPENSCDRWTLLKYILPTFAAIAAGAFGGALTARGSVSQVAVVASGGFAVWFLAILLIGVPDRCNHPNVYSFRSLENSAGNKEGSIGEQVPKILKDKSGTYDKASGDFALFILAVVDNIWTGPRGRIDLDIDIVGLDDNGKVAWSEHDRYDALDAWAKGSIAARHKVSGVEDFLGIQNAASSGKFVLAWVIECLTEQERAKWNGVVEIRVTDSPDSRPRLWRIRQPLSLYTRPKMAVLEPSACKSS